MSEPHLSEVLAVFALEINNLYLVDENRLNRYNQRYLCTDLVNFFPSHLTSQACKAICIVGAVVDDVRTQNCVRLQNR